MDELRQECAIFARERKTMSTTAMPHVDCEQHHATLSVTDVPAAVDFYTKKLGFHLAFLEDPPAFAGVNLDQVQIFLSKGTPSPKGCSVHFVVGDADELCAFHRANGVEIAAAPEDKPYGLRDYTIRDLYGYHLNFGHCLPATAPPLKIERAD